MNFCPTKLVHRLVDSFSFQVCTDIAFSFLYQPGRLQVDLKKADKHMVGPRGKFKVQSFVDKYDLGTTVAGKFLHGIIW